MSENLMSETLYMNYADDENDTVKYESTHKQPLKTIILYRLIFSPNLP